jgi:hypothetical protein
LNCEQSDPEDPLLHKAPPLQYHQQQQATSGSVQLSFSKTFHLKIIFLFQIGFLMSLLLSVTNKQNTVSTV